MADLHVKVTNRLRFLKDCRKNGTRAKLLMEITQDITTTILNSCSSYPVPIHVETRNALIKSICEHSDLFTFRDMKAMVERINELRTCQHDTVDDSAATSKGQKATSL